MRATNSAMFQTRQSFQTEKMLSDYKKDFQAKSSQVLDKILAKKSKVKKRKDDKQFRRTFRNYFPEATASLISAK